MALLVASLIVHALELLGALLPTSCPHRNAVLVLTAPMARRAWAGLPGCGGVGGWSSAGSGRCSVPPGGFDGDRGGDLVGLLPRCPGGAGLGACTYGCRGTLRKRSNGLWSPCWRRCSTLTSADLELDGRACPLTRPCLPGR